MDRVRMIVFGRVQGVGFRAFVQREARGVGVHGTVWNRADGAVELEAEGDRMPLERLAEAMRRGCAGAHVTAVEVEWSQGPSRHQGFTIGASRPR